MATPAFKSGKGGKASVNGNDIPITGWDVAPSTDIQRFRNSQTGSFSVKEGTYHDARVTITLDYDSANNVFAAPFSVIQGAILTNVILTRIGASVWTFPLFIVTGTPETLTVDGKIVTRIVGEPSGTFSVPGGASPT